MTKAGVTTGWLVSPGGKDALVAKSADGGRGGNEEHQTRLDARYEKTKKKCWKFQRI